MLTLILLSVLKCPHSCGAEMMSLQDRLAVPDEASRKAADKLARDIFKDEITKGAPLARPAFIRKLLQQAGESKADPATCYVLFTLAQEQAALTGDLDLVWKVADDTVAVFTTDALAAKEAAIQKLPAKTPDDQRRAAQAWLRLAPELIAAGEFERADKACSAASSQARKAKEIATAARADALAKDAAALKEKYRGLPQARLTLLTQAGDPAANALVGRFDCFIRNDWPAGLPRLAKGADAALKDAAANELAAPGDPSKLVAIADAWSAVAEKETGASRLTVLRHAGVFYRSAAAGMSGLTKLKVERRIEEIVKEAGAADEVNLIKLFDPKLDLIQGTWSVSGNSLVSGDLISLLEWPYTPPDEYDVKATVERKGGTLNLLFGFVAGGRQVAISIDEPGDITGMGRIDGKLPAENPTCYRGKLLLPDRETAIVLSVRKSGVKLAIDGKTIFDWKGEASHLSRNPAAPLRRNDTLYMASSSTQWDIKSLVLVPISGTGKKLR